MSFRVKSPLLFCALLGCVSQAGALSLQPKNFTTGAYTTKQVNGVTVWEPDNPQSILHFDVPGSFSFVPGEPVYVEIEYVDSDPGRLFVEYDSGYGGSPAEINYDAEIHTRSSRVGTGQLVKSYQVFENPLFANRQSGQTDFRMRLLNWSGTPMQVASVTISTTIFPDERLQYAASRPWLQPYTGEALDLVDAKSVNGKVMAGYQGWFFAPNDLRDNGWNHWGRSKDVAPSPTEITVDMWPWMDEYDPDRIYRAGSMQLGDGRPAYLFSSTDLDTVRTHFRWMREYNIDGVYLQRFVNRNNSGYYGNQEFVLHNVRQAAREEGRVWAIEYDISELDSDPDPLLVMQNDWNWLVNEAGILNDPRYLHENGKPVLFIWGFSVSGRNFTLSQANEIVNWFAAQNLYLIGGVPKNWEDKTEWHSHYQLYDQLLGWNAGGAPDDLTSERLLLETWGMKLLPHISPGFSWHNLKMLVPFSSYTARRRGTYYWERILAAINSGADQIFIGMFDEYDESTAVMPMTDNHPAPHTEWGSYITNAGRDPFWWLALSAFANEMLDGVRPFNSTEPTEADVAPAAFTGPDATAFLGPVNDEDGLFLVSAGDGQTFSAVYGGQDCRTNEVDPDAARYFYFDIDDAFVPGIPGEQSVMVEIEVYVTESNTSVRLQYDALGSDFQLAAAPVAFPQPGAWTTVRWFLDDAAFQNGQNGGADFRLIILKEKLAAIRRVSVFLPHDPAASQGVDPAVRIDHSNGQFTYPDRLDAVGWRLYQSTNLLPGSWLPVPDTDISFSDDAVFHLPDLSPGARFFRLEHPD